MKLINKTTGKELFHITTNHSMTVEEAIALWDIEWKDDGQGNMYCIDADGAENYLEDIEIV